MTPATLYNLTQASTVDLSHFWNGGDSVRGSGGATRVGLPLTSYCTVADVRIEGFDVGLCVLLVLELYCNVHSGNKAVGGDCVLG